MFRSRYKDSRFFDRCSKQIGSDVFGGPWDCARAPDQIKDISFGRGKNMETCFQCSICRGGLTPSGASQPSLSTLPSLYQPSSRKNSQNKSKIHCWSPSGFPTNRELHVFSPPPLVHWRTEGFWRPGRRCELTPLPIDVSDWQAPKALSLAIGGGGLGRMPQMPTPLGAYGCQWNPFLNNVNTIFNLWGQV